jgi:hypothetical protein
MVNSFGRPLIGPQDGMFVELPKSAAAVVSKVNLYDKYLRPSRPAAILWGGPLACGRPRVGSLAAAMLRYGAGTFARRFRLPTGTGAGGRKRLPHKTQPLPNLH